MMIALSTCATDHSPVVPRFPFTTVNSVQTMHRRIGPPDRSARVAADPGPQVGGPRTFRSGAMPPDLDRVNAKLRSQMQFQGQWRPFVVGAWINQQDFLRWIGLQHAFENRNLVHATARRQPGRQPLYLLLVAWVPAFHARV